MINCFGLYDKLYKLTRYNKNMSEKVVIADAQRERYRSINCANGIYLVDSDELSRVFTGDKDIPSLAYKFLRFCEDGIIAERTEDVSILEEIAGNWMNEQAGKTIMEKTAKANSDPHTYRQRVKKIS